MKKFTEQNLVEDYLIDKLQNKGWTFIPADELERDSYEEPLLVPNLMRAIKRINKGLDIGDEEIRHVINELKFKRGIEGAKQILNFYKFGVPIKLEKERIVRYIQLFDYSFQNNEFIVSRQFNYDGKERIRTDIMLYINGIPLVNIECKNPASISESWYNAYRQIKDYENIAPDLYKYVQIGVAAESKAKYFPIVPWQEEVKINEWKEEPLDSIDSTIEMLSPNTLMDVLRNFLFFRVELGNATKVITRYMQYRAAKKMVNRVISNLEGEEEKDSGLIWHWQGSGKTLTMLFAANELHYSPELENPTIFFIVDRIELEEQLYREFYSLDIAEAEIIGSIDELKEVLSYDYYRGKRGIFITLIHKFRPEELSQLQKELEQQSETIMDRKNVIAFIDEGHRTQYGTLAAQMNAILKNAFFFALTGTPISKRGRDTYLEFSYPPEEKYLDRYFITDSIRDGYTVKIAYQPRLEEYHLKKDMLESFLEVELEELPEEVKEQVEDRVKKRLNPIVLFLENPRRIEVVAKDIADHFKENVDGKFKAMVVAASRIACAHYKMELDKHLPKDYSEVIMTYERDEKKPIRDYVKEARERYGEKEIEEIRKESVEKFKEEGYPKILIVTDMLLTGFDAPVLQTMYLDKPLKEHRLLQAVARTNRPFGDFKEAGLIVDYVGILKSFKKALEMYSEEDIEGALYSMDSIREEFNTLIREIMELLDVPMDYDRETLLKAIEIITTDEQKEKEFVENYRKLRKVFELLGTDEIKLERFEEYKWISAVYTYYMKTVIRRPYEGYVQKYFDKTVKFVHKSTEVEKLDREMPVIVFDENYLKNLEEKVKNKKEKAANILFTLNRLVLVDRYKNPVYESLADRVEKLLKMWKEKTEEYGRMYGEGAEIIEEMQKLSKRQRDLGFSDVEYSMLLTLEERLGRNDDLINDIRELSQTLKPYTFRNWVHQVTARKTVEREVRRFVRRYAKKYGLEKGELDQLYEKLIENVKNYGS